MSAKFPRGGSRTFFSSKSIRNQVNQVLCLNYVVTPALFYRKKGYINFVPKLIRRPSVCPSVCYVKFLVNVSPPKPLDVELTITIFNAQYCPFSL